MNSSTVKFKVVERVVLKKKNKDSSVVTKNLSERTIRTFDYPSPNLNQKTPNRIENTASKQIKRESTPHHNNKTENSNRESLQKNKAKEYDHGRYTPKHRDSPLHRSTEQATRNNNNVKTLRNDNSIKKENYRSSEAELSNSEYSPKRTFESSKKTHVQPEKEFYSEKFKSTSNSPKKRKESPNDKKEKKNDSYYRKKKRTSKSYSDDDNSSTPSTYSLSSTGIKRMQKGNKVPATIRAKSEEPVCFLSLICSASVVLNSNTKYVKYLDIDEKELSRIAKSCFFGEMSIAKLRLPKTDQFEKYSILVPEQFISDPGFLNEYNPLGDLISTVSAIGDMIEDDCSEKEEIFDSTTGIFRQLERAKNKRNGNEFLSAIGRFNNLLNSPDIKFKSFNGMKMPFEIANHIFGQIYNRCITEHVDKLRNYRAFSNNVYGEVNPVLVNEFIKRCGLGPSDVFVDLGCGIGNVVIQVSMQAGCASYGIEIMDTPAKLAEMQVCEYNARTKVYGLDRGEVEIIHGDFLESSFVLEKLRTATVVLVNNHAFDTNLNHRLMQIFLDMKDGAKIISLKSFAPLDFKINDHNVGSLESILKVRQYPYWSDCVSWTSNSGHYYIHTIDRSALQQFYSSKTSVF
ncbi:hypothetical protein BB558_004496 [Smittium angustum]|uniref:Histone-lysine N-methyltransferase, H3 lysine-79 specific n=1 Tax=Smittium angustum TaxID=133377 RepID=A0A2U1J371_SMIAN|nr:hypothetical protein BB558_004496 [Smittium angustum]